MSAGFSSTTRVLLATATVGVAAVVAFALLYPPVPPQESTSQTSDTPSTSATSITFITTSRASITTTSSTSIISTSSSSAISSQTSSTTTTTTHTTTSRTLNATNLVTLPYGIGQNESLNFQPSTITVVIGVNNTIVWSDLDADQHTVTSISVPSGAAKFDSGILNQGQTFRVTLTVPGTYRYFCTIHPTWMRGTIIVKA